MKNVMLLASRNQQEDLQYILEDSCTLLPCHDPCTARELLDRHPDVLILSLPLAGMDGLEFLEEHALDLPRRILVLTTVLNSYILDTLSRLNVDTVMRLPISPGSLQKKLNDLCTKKRPS